MAQPIKVSIITATFNSGMYVGNTINSVINQTYSNIEYIIVDGGSTDNTIQIVERYTDKIATIISEPDNGVYDAFNKGILMATGDIVYFLNSDDFLYDNSIIEQVVSLFNDNNSLSAVYGNILCREPTYEMDQVYGREFNEDDFIKGYMPPHQALFVKRSMFEKYGMFDLNYSSSSDFDFIVKLYLNERSKILYIEQIIAVFRTGGLSTHYKTRIIGMRETEKLIEKYFNKQVDLSNAEINNNALFRHWLESLILHERGITSRLHNQNIHKTTIFGTMKTAHYLLNDLTKEGFSVEAFIDNNKKMQGKEIKGIPIVSLDWLESNKENIDAVIVSLESANAINVINDLEQSFGQHLKVISWKQLI